uniref:SAM-dependent methyltransferases n=1 Tax=uncultured Chloroflexi bacterium HF0500_03M05 TaxID=710737 RepID=E0XY79_9CHLR|nr:SAM-dependent methyltransferases [uncultured Chloroflexi bacterium HF0500_03M05]
MKPEEFSFKKFSSNPFYSQQNARLIDMAEVDSGQRIVDLACGTGGVTQQIAERLRGARDSVIIAIDHSALALKQAMEDLKDVRNAAIQFVQSHVEQASGAVKEKVDTVIFCNAIHYIPDKDALLADISRTLKPGGKLAFNTTFFEGAHLPETFPFYRKWMLKASRSLRQEYGLSPVRSARVEARKQLSPEEYRRLVESHGFRVTRQEIDTVQFTIDGFLDISTFEDFIIGVMPGIPFDKASASLKIGIRQTFEEMNVEYIPRNWLDVVAVRR